MTTSQNPYPPHFLFAYLAILIWSPLPLASNRPWSLNLLCLLILVLAFALTVFTLVKNTNTALLLGPHKPVIALLALVPLWSTVQALPLSYSIVETLSPAAAQIQQAAQLTSFTLSLEPAATQQMALFSWCLWLFFLVTLLLVDTPERTRTVFNVIVWCGVFQAVYGSFMTLSGLEYGFFVKKEAYLGRATGTFVNRNHLAGYLEMCLAVGIGLLVASLNQENRRGWRNKLRHTLDTLLGPKMRLRIFLALMVIALVLTRSRMGNSAFFFALPVCGIGMMVIQKKLHKGAIILFASLMLVDFLIVGQWFGFEEVAERIQSTSMETESRDEVIRDTLVMLRDYRIAGVGAGTYYSSYPQYQGADVRGFYDHAHNDYLEFAVELGLVGFTPLALAVLLSLVKSITSMANRRDQLAKGVAFATTMGIISLLIHSAVDFNLKIPANALLFIGILAFAQLSVTLPRERS